MLTVISDTRNCTECGKKIIGAAQKSSGVAIRYPGLWGTEGTIIPGYAHPECVSKVVLEVKVCKKCRVLKPCDCE